MKLKVVKVGENLDNTQILLLLTQVLVENTFKYIIQCLKSCDYDFNPKLKNSDFFSFLCVQSSPNPSFYFEKQLIFSFSFCVVFSFGLKSS